MSNRISRLWLLGPPVAILISLLAYYATFPSVRQWVDARFPWVEENIGSRLRQPKASPAPRRVAAAPMPETRGEPMADPARPAAPSFLAADGSVDVTKLAADRSAWPPTVVLKAAKEFPAVVGGKVVGKVNVPAGTEAKLVSIQDGKLGLEYQGGGAWLAIEETDLAKRLAR